MSPLPKLSAAAVEFLVWAGDDYTEAFVLRDILKRLKGALSGEEEREEALDVLGELLQADLIRVGEMRRNTVGIDYWDNPASELIARLEACWSSASPPRMGEGPWFYVTDRGRQFVDNLN